MEYRDALIFGAAAAAALLAYRSYKSHEAPSPTTFTVLSWNVLAREFTMFNKEEPGCVRGHHNPDDKLESRAQTAARYGLATDALLARAPDAVLLQELSVDFFDGDVNPRADALLALFRVAHKIHSPGKPGTAVLLRKDSPLEFTGTVLSAGASEELTGGTSKSACGVLVTVAGRGTTAPTAIWLISLHMAPHKYNPQGASKLLELIGDSYRHACLVENAPAARVVLGGDFNAEPHEMDTLQREAPFLGGLLARLVPPGPTGLSADFGHEETIDHLLLSPGLHLQGPMEMERRPAGGPYAALAAGGAGVGGAASVVAPSDHVWQSIRVAIA